MKNYSATSLLRFLVCVLFASQISPSWALSLGQPHERAELHEYFLGNLGGMIVKLPLKQVGTIQIDRSKPDPSSSNINLPRISSMGFYYSSENGAIRSSSKIDGPGGGYTIFNTPWVLVGLNSGSSFPGSGFLDRGVIYKIEDPDKIGYKYEYLGKEHGLETYLNP